MDRLEVALEYGVSIVDFDGLQVLGVWGNGLCVGSFSLGVLFLLVSGFIIRKKRLNLSSPQGTVKFIPHPTTAHQS